MQITVSSKNGHLRATEKQYMIEHAAKLLDLFERIEAIGIVVSWERREHHEVGDVKIFVNCEHEHAISAESHSDTMELHPAFHAALKKVQTQVRKHKEKIQDHHRGKKRHERENDESSVGA